MWCIKPFVTRRDEFIELINPIVTITLLFIQRNNPSLAGIWAPVPLCNWAWSRWSTNRPPCFLLIIRCYIWSEIWTVNYATLPHVCRWSLEYWTIVFAERQNTVNTFHENNGSFERVWAFKFGIMFGFGLNTKLGSIQRFVMLWGYKICNKILKMEHQQKWFSLVTCKFQQLVKITFRNEKGQVLIKLNLNNCFYFFENKFSLLNLNHLKVIISV